MYESQGINKRYMCTFSRVYYHSYLGQSYSLSRKAKRNEMKKLHKACTHTHTDIRIHTHTHIYAHKMLNGGLDPKPTQLSD